MGSSVSEYFTCDSRIASFVAHLGVKHIRTESDARKGCKFVFDDPLTECGTLATNFFAGCGSTDCLALLDSYRDVSKTMRIAERDGIWTNKEL
jgi:hypothetical protein